MNLFKKIGSKILAIGSSPVIIGNVAPATKNGEVLVYEQLTSGGSACELIGSVGFADVNANIGVNSFTIGSFPYSGRAVVSVVAKITQLFNVDTVTSMGIKDITGSVSSITTLGTSVNALSIQATTSFVQTSGGNYALFVTSFGNYAGGNTTGNVDIYVLFADVP